MYYRYDIFESRRSGSAASIPIVFYSPMHWTVVGDVAVAFENDAYLTGSPNQKQKQVEHLLQQRRLKEIESLPQSAVVEMHGGIAVNNNGSYVVLREVVRYSEPPTVSWRVVILNKTVEGGPVQTVSYLAYYTEKAAIEGADAFVRTQRVAPYFHSLDSAMLSSPRLLEAQIQQIWKDGFARLHSARSREEDRFREKFAKNPDAFTDAELAAYFRRKREERNRP